MFFCLVNFIVFFSFCIKCDHIMFIILVIRLGGDKLFCCLFDCLSTDHSTLWWMVVGVNWLTLCHECAHDSVLGPSLFLLFTSELFSILENNLIGNADDSTLIAVAIPRCYIYSSRVPDP